MWKEKPIAKRLEQTARDRAEFLKDTPLASA